MTRRHLASPLYGTRTLAGTDSENLQTQSPWNPVRLTWRTGGSRDSAF
jgi:hypothetical protein